MLALAGAEAVPVPVLDRAGRIARGLQAEVEIFLSLYEPDLVQTLATRELLERRIAALIEEEHRRLERQADHLRDQGTKVRASVRWDYPMYEGVIRQVLRHRPDLLIVSAIRANEVTSRTLAYREARLIEACPCPLLLLKQREVYPRGGVVAALDPLQAHETPQALDELVIGAAKTVAAALADAPVHLYQATDPASSFGGAGAPATLPTADRQAARVAVAQARMRDMALRHDIGEESARFEIGLIEAALPAFAREKRAQLVVMGAASIERVLDALECDVLLVKPERFRTPVSAEHAPAVPHPA